MTSVGAWLFQLWIRITGYPVYRFRANPKFKYEDRKVQGRIIKGKAVIVSNHTTVWDFGFWLYALPLRAHRCIMADVLMHKNFFLSLFLRMNQGIFVSRRAQDLGFIKKCEKILSRGGVVQVFPEATTLVASPAARPSKRLTTTLWLLFYALMAFTQNSEKNRPRIPYEQHDVQFI